MSTTLTIDFGAGFDVTESPADEFNVTLDLTEYTGDYGDINFAADGIISTTSGKITLVPASGPVGAVGGILFELGGSAGDAAVLGTASDVISTTGVEAGVLFWGSIVNAGNAGNAVIQWAQNTADASDTIVRAGSYIKHIQVT